MSESSEMLVKLAGNGGTVVALSRFGAFSGLGRGVARPGRWRVRLLGQTPRDGNCVPAVADYRKVGCKTIREAMSAQLDGEDDPHERPSVDAHLATCAECRQWLDLAAAVNRLARTSQAPDVAPLGDDALAIILAAVPGRGRARLALTLRALLGVLATVQLLLGLLQVTDFGMVDGQMPEGTTMDGASPDHLWHESAAWNLAIGAGFLWIAARRSRPNGIIPTLTAFIGVLTLLSVVDIAHGRVEPIHLASHGLILAGYLIVLSLTKPGLHTGDPQPHRRPVMSHFRARFDNEEPAFAGPISRQPDTGAPAARSDRYHAA